jgi:hypothetical protein
VPSLSDFIFLHYFVSILGKKVRLSPVPLNVHGRSYLVWRPISSRVPNYLFNSPPYGPMTTAQQSSSSGQFRIDYVQVSGEVALGEHINLISPRFCPDDSDIRYWMWFMGVTRSEFFSCRTSNSSPWTTSTG